MAAVPSAELQRMNSFKTTGMNTIFIGNPGTGKSTLINCYAKEHLFKSGVSRDGTGITFQLDVRKFADRTFMDTPGLSDIKLREAAATAIDQALRAGGFFQIVFVITLESGRLKPDDLTTMRLVLEAAGQITENSFAILVNKCTKGFLKKLDRPAWTKLHQEACEQRRIRLTHHLHFVPVIPELDDEDNEITSLDEDTLAFFNSFPSIKIDAEQVQNVKVENFEEVMEQMTAMQDSLAVAERAQLQAENKAADESARLAEAQGDILALQKQAAARLADAQMLAQQNQAAAASKHSFVTHGLVAGAGAVVSAFGVVATCATGVYGGLTGDQRGVEACAGFTENALAQTGEHFVKCTDGITSVGPTGLSGV